MPIYEYDCPVHGAVEHWMTKYDPPVSIPCPVELYEGDEGDDGEIMDCTEVLCGEDSPRVLSVLGGAFVEGGTGARRNG